MGEGRILGPYPGKEQGCCWTIWHLYNFFKGASSPRRLEKCHTDFVRRYFYCYLQDNFSNEYSISTVYHTHTVFLHSVQPEQLSTAGPAGKQQAGLWPGHREKAGRFLSTLAAG